eukprot:647863-Rhodomonas_salina.3
MTQALCIVEEALEVSPIWKAAHVRNPGHTAVKLNEVTRPGSCVGATQDLNLFAHEEAASSLHLFFADVSGLHAHARASHPRGVDHLQIPSNGLHSQPAPKRVDDGHAQPPRVADGPPEA